jgi:hypothetical protein
MWKERITLNCLDIGVATFYGSSVLHSLFPGEESRSCLSVFLFVYSHQVQAKANWHRGSGTADIPGVRTVYFFFGIT